MYFFNNLKTHLDCSSSVHKEKFTKINLLIRQIFLNYFRIYKNVKKQAPRKILSRLQIILKPLNLTFYHFHLMEH